MDNFIIQGFDIFGGGDEQSPPKVTPDGIFITYPDKSRKRSLSKSIVETIDLISEGPVDTLVSGYYRNHGGYLGRTGWVESEFVPYVSDLNSNTQELNPLNSGVLRSVFYNDVPILDKNIKFNYNEIDFKFVNGSADGVTGVGSQSLIDSELTITRYIGESLVGPNFTYSSEGYPIPRKDVRIEKFKGDYDSLLDSDPDAALINNKVYRINNKDCIGFKLDIKINSLGYTELENKDNIGDDEPYFFDFQVNVSPFFSNDIKKDIFNSIETKNISLEGKVSKSPFIYQTRINLNDLSADPEFLGWEVQIIRKTAEAIHPSVNVSASVENITEIYSKNYRYPFSCIASNKFDAEFFTQIPNRTYEIRGKKIKLPDNYNPISKNYTDDWDGTFADNKQWSNNPAWVFYDIYTNDLYGLGNSVSEDDIDKWTLYQIGQYCDELVPNGLGNRDVMTSGLEPRFECNVVLNEAKEAYGALNDLASVFRGLNYYAGGQISVAQDSPKEPVAVFTNANVLDGNFTYSSSAKRARHTVAIVRYNDRNNFFNPSVEYVEDIEGIRRYGIKQKDLTAIGTTSQGQAIRLGKWFLTTERLETDTVSFKTGPEACYLRPGDVVKVFDEHKTKKRYSGRTLKTEIYHPVGGIGQNAQSGAKILLDRKIKVSDDFNYIFSLLTPSYNYDPSITNLSNGFTSADISGIRRSFIQEVSFSGRNVTEISGLSQILFTGQLYNEDDASQFSTGNFSGGLFNVENGLIWSVENSGDLSQDDYQDYRVVRVTEDKDHSFNVFATEYQSSKFAEIESGMSLQYTQGGGNLTVGSPAITNIDYQAPNDSTPFGRFRFTIEPGENNDYVIYYAKLSESNQTYSSSTRPDDTEKVGLIPVYGNKYINIPHNVYRNGYHDFSFWGLNGAKYSSAGAVYSSDSNNGNAIFINDITLPINTVEISSLVTKDQQFDGAGGGTRTLGNFERNMARASLKWNVGYNTTLDEIFKNDFGSQFTSLIHFYPAGDTSVNKPTTNLIETQRQSFSNIGSYDLTTERNISLAGGPYRSIDIAVEVEDENEITSSNNFSLSDGYDIIQLNNPAPSAITNQSIYGVDLVKNGNAIRTISVRIPSHLYNIQDIVTYRGYCFFFNGGSQDFDVATARYHTIYYNTSNKFRNSLAVGIPLEPNIADTSINLSIVFLDQFDLDIGRYFEQNDKSNELESYIRNKVGSPDRIGTTSTYS